MFNVNEYFNGKVKSIALQTAEGRATIGAMAKGEYEFDTKTVEHMTVITGKLIVKLTEQTEWKEFVPNQTFIVAENSKFQLRVPEDSSYLCIYK